jgi:hypothetical protein
MRSLRSLMVVITVAATAAAQWVKIPPATENLSGPPPKAADGKPDLSGIWIANDHQRHFMNLASDLQPPEAPMQPWARAVQQQREADLHRDDPLASCLPHGVPRVGTSGVHPFKIIQTPKLVVMLYEQLGLWRQVFLDGREPAKDPNPAWLGYSTGRWEGDTLVVETTGFNDKTWLDTFKGHPATEALRVTERFRRKEFGSLEIGITIDDPRTYTRPWTATEFLHLLPDTELFEFVCNENEKDAPHMVGR